MTGGNFHHPLDNLIKDNRLFMLEALLPFVSDNMKAPLAMYIKLMELQLIMKAFGDRNYVNSCGLHKDINNQEDILSSLAGCGFSGLTGQFENIKKTMDMVKSMDESGTIAGFGAPHKTHGFGSDNGCAESDTNDPYVHYGAKATFHDTHNNYDTSDLYGSVKDLFEAYDRKGL